MSTKEYGHDDDVARRAEAGAEAGAGADTTGQAPQNVLLNKDIEHNDNTSSSAADDDDAARPVAAADEATGGDDGAQEKGQGQSQVGAAGGPPNRPAPAAEKMSKAKIALIMSALCMAVFLAALDITIITTALPTISAHFHSSTVYTWIGSAYLLGAAASTPIWGKVSDIFGRKPMLLIANLVFFVGSLLSAVSVNAAMLIAARAIQGCGGGGLLVLVNICIGDLFSVRSRGAYYGMIGGVWAMASAIGPLVGGAFTQRVSWRWCFYINLPLDGGAFLIILFFLNNLDHPGTPIWEGLKAIDWLGSLLIVGGTIMFLLGLEFGGQTFPWDSAGTICLLVFGAVSIALFFLNEWRLAKYPVVPLDLFSTRHNLACLAVCFCHGYVFIGGSYYLPLYFQACLGASPILSGVYTLCTALSLSLASVATGIYIRKTGQYLPPIWLGWVLLVIGYALFTNLYVPPSWPKIIIYQIIAGLGVGPQFQAPLIALQSNINPRDIAAATATFQFSRNIATSISVVVGGVVFQNAMARRRTQLIAALGPSTAQALSGLNAGASVSRVNALPPKQRDAARVAFAASLREMWMMYVAFAGLGLLLALLIRRKTLTKEHEQTRTGLQAEREKRADRVKGRGKGGAVPVGDVEAAAVATTAAAGEKEGVS